MSICSLLLQIVSKSASRTLGVGIEMLDEWHLVCLSLNPYAYALCVCLMCLPYVYALCVCLMCMPNVYALCVCMRHLVSPSRNP